MKIIPAIDIIEGKCVRLTQGDYSQKKIYSENPLEVARKFENAGLKYLHLVDLDGAKAGKIVNYKILEDIAKKTDLIIDFGGGIKSDKDIELAFDSGAQQVTCGTIAVKDPNKVAEWLEKYGNDQLILGADVIDGHVAIRGWTEKTTLSIEDLLHKYLGDGMHHVICTDIRNDGTLAGPSFDLYEKLLHTFPEIDLIASGGIGSLGDILKLKKAGLGGVIIGKAIYEGKIDLEELTIVQNA